MNFYQSYVYEDSAGRLIHRVARLLRLSAQNYFREQDGGITPEQWGLLLKVAENEGSLQSQLADPVLKDHPNTTKMLDALDKIGLIQRRASERDRRAKAVFLTEAGKAFLDHHLPAVIVEKERYFAGLDRHDLNALLNCLKSLEKNMERILGEPS